MIEASGTHIRDLPAIGIVAETGCRFLKEGRFPDWLYAGLHVERLGTSSVVYWIALFRRQEEDLCAVGRFVHVDVRAGRV